MRVWKDRAYVAVRRTDRRIRGSGDGAGMVMDREMVWLGWQEKANCETPQAQAAARHFTDRDGNPATLMDLYYPSPEDKDSTKRAQLVQRICNACEVKQECLNYALRVKESHGVWGGLTTPERENLRMITELQAKVEPAKTSLKEIVS
jgi:WhiB family redox-sensing transcriptional regulator